MFYATFHVLDGCFGVVVTDACIIREESILVCVFEPGVLFLRGGLSKSSAGEETAKALYVGSEGKGRPGMLKANQR